ncbi:MAG TPA: Gfo/Idh/MocA family oxidoreductase, partial [Armatimonadota bacterium]
GQEFAIPANRRYTTLSGYRRLLEQKLDAVVIESPPYFHPEQAAAGIAAGKHVYLAKPVAVDVPGCQTIEATGKAATDKKLCFLVDFQTRANDSYREVAKRVHDGGIGKIVSCDASYACGPTFTSLDQLLRKSPTDPETRLRAWGIDKRISGDIITEQNIHAIDVACWMLNGHPEKAYGTGGRTRDFIGDCWDHFAVIYQFPKGVFTSFNSKQVGGGFDDIQCRVYGDNGTADTHYFGKVVLIGDDPFNGGTMTNLYTEGAVRNIGDFHKAVTQGPIDNSTVAASVASNLTTILGRTAAYKGTEVTWDEMLRAAEKMDPQLGGLKS